MNGSEQIKHVPALDTLITLVNTNLDIAENTMTKVIASFPAERPVELGLALMKTREQTAGDQIERFDPAAKELLEPYCDFYVLQGKTIAEQIQEGARLEISEDVDANSLNTPGRRTEIAVPRIFFIGPYERHNVKILFTKIMESAQGPRNIDEALKHVDYYNDGHFTGSVFKPLSEDLRREGGGFKGAKLTIGSASEQLELIRHARTLGVNYLSGSSVVLLSDTPASEDKVIGIGRNYADEELLILESYKRSFRSGVIHTIPFLVPATVIVKPPYKFEAPTLTRKPR